VIAIIGILVSLLIPALGKAKEVANKASCSSNLHQIGIALEIYAQHNKDHYPDARTLPLPIKPSTGPPPPPVSDMLQSLKTMGSTSRRFINVRRTCGCSRRHWRGDGQQQLFVQPGVVGGDVATERAVRESGDERDGGEPGGGCGQSVFTLTDDSKVAVPPFHGLRTRNLVFVDGSVRRDPAR